MRLLTIVACLASFVCLQFLATNTSAQEIRKAIRDYNTEFNYQPSDPWNRGKMFNIHTKHYGKFYNCDCEESKRNSPYICWKPHTDKDFPTRVSMLECIRRDLTGVRQRVKDGAGACYKENCRCSKCTSQTTSNSNCGCTQSSGCSTCAAGNSNSNVIAQQIETKPAPSKRAPARQFVQQDDEPNGKFGLVKGKIVPEFETTQPSRVARTTTEKKAGKKSLLNYFR